MGSDAALEQQEGQELRAWSSGFTAQGNAAGESCGTGSARQGLLLLPWHAECWVCRGWGAGALPLPTVCWVLTLWGEATLTAEPGGSFLFDVYQE